MTDFQIIIKQQLNLQNPSASGFYPVRCAVCNDYKIRAGFKFEEDGTIGYNCFRGKCDANCIYTPTEKISFKFRQLMNAFNIQIPLEIKRQNIDKKTTTQSFDETLYEKHFFSSQTLPKGIIKYDPDKHSVIKNYLYNSRYMTDENYYIGESGYWGGRLIIPFYYYETLIGWQAINIYNDKSTRHFETGGDNTHLVYFANGQISNSPIITEGVFDAKSVPFGCAVLHNKITKKQAYFFRNKTPYLLPDRAWGEKFIDAAKEYDWPVIIPKYKEKDANEALKKYGRVALAKHLRENIVTKPSIAEMKYNLWRKRNK